MKKACRTPFMFLLACGVLAAGLRSGGAMEADFIAVVEVIEDRCMTSVSYTHLTLPTKRIV